MSTVNNYKRNKTKKNPKTPKQNSTSSLHAHMHSGTEIQHHSAGTILGFPQSKARNKQEWGLICLGFFCWFFVGFLLVFFSRDGSEDFAFWFTTNPELNQKKTY